MTGGSKYVRGGLAKELAEDADANLQGAGLAQDAAADLRVGGCPRRRGCPGGEEVHMPQQTDADGLAQSPPVRPTYTTAVAGSQLLLARSTFTVTGSPVRGSSDSITTGRPATAETLGRR